MIDSRSVRFRTILSNPSFVRGETFPCTVLRVTLRRNEDVLRVYRSGVSQMFLGFSTKTLSLRMVQVPKTKISLPM